ncbi:restriction endonuclease subunit S [Streptomyces sp. NPDC059441]|uniref:restriction endonuclease subunit S n=1 Tax=Streptomyces sp. NPDC059441 TaxID=3346829 RepID=UPI0036836E3E
MHGEASGSDFPKVPLGSLLTQKPKNGYSPKDVPGWTGLQALGLGCLTATGFAPVQLKNVPDTALARRSLLADGDLLMSRANTRELVGLVGRFTGTGHDCIYPDLMMRLRPDEALCLPAYLEIVLRSDRVRRDVRAGARGTSDSMVKISAPLVEGLEIPLPRIEEQHQIVGTHVAFGRRITALEQVRRKLVETKHAALSEGLNGQRRTLLLDDLLEEIQSGWSPACDSYPPGADEWGVVRVSAVTSGRFDPVESKRLPPGLQPRALLEIEEGDVLVARANGARSLVGAVCYVGPTRRGLMLSDKTLRLVPRLASAEPKFLALLLASDEVRSQIGNLLNGGTGQNNISQADLRSLKVPVVPIEEQRRLVAAQAFFQRRIEALEVQAAKLRTVQQGVVEDLLAGRVHIPEVASVEAA